MENKQHLSSKAAAFVEENIKTIFAYALSRVSNKTDAEDLTNDIVLAILQNAEKLKNPDTFYGYIWGIAANTYRKFLHKRNRVCFEEIDESLTDLTDFTEDILAREEAQILRREIALLSREYRECTIDYYFDDLSCAEIAKKRNISLEMVKYYLFKTRKILKEGICMEREFGEKSFRPVPFEFYTIFSGSDNAEYRRLFSRKLPGQILMSAYYTPMSIRELAIELGVASIYLEDELKLLENYHLLTRTETGKYQTNLVIYTEEYCLEFYKNAEKYLLSDMKILLSRLREKLAQIKPISVVTNQLSDDRLYWGLLFPVLFAGYRKFAKQHPENKMNDEIYDGATGVNYGMAALDLSEKYSPFSFAGYARINDQYYASAADFRFLPEKSRYFVARDTERFSHELTKMHSGELKPTLLILTQSENEQIFTLLDEEVHLMAEIYDKLLSLAIKSMTMHAPKSVEKQINKILTQTLYFQTLGFLGHLALKSGEITIPTFDGPAAVCIYENNRQAAMPLYEYSDVRD